MKLGLTVREAEEVVRRLADVQLIDPETWQPMAWEKRQFKSDDATGRVKKNGVKTTSCLIVTEMKRYMAVTVTEM